MEIKATDLSAKLLATENLTVVRAAVQTASFDIKSRVLTLPMWKEMTPEIEDMLVGHEVGHALYTGEKYMKPIEENPKMMEYLNVIEDVRIEKLIKRKYPGLRKRMNDGYKQLLDRDFFGISKMDLSDINLIDRINLYFKAGYQCGVKFDADEKVFVNRAERCESMEEVIELAQDIYDYAREQAEEKVQKQRQQRMSQKAEDQDSEDEDMDDDNSSSWENESDEDQEFKPRGRGAEQPKTEDDEIDEEMQSKTERNFKEQLDNLADQSTVYQYHKIQDFPFSPVVSYKRVLKDLTFDFDDNLIGSWQTRYVYDGKSEESYVEKTNQELNKFKADSTSSVNYLVKEFEMRKSAHQYKRAQISKTGSLDMRKVYAYKLQDDLFKRVTVLPNGKNHGMMFLLDWSGSMSDVIMDTLKQVINLCMFCNKAQIPYEVFAFTSQYISTDEERMARRDYIYSQRDMSKQNGVSYVETHADFHLLELFSNRMSMTEFNTMVKKLLDRRVFWHRGYDLGGTPLNEALVWVYNNLGEYMKSNRIEKMNFITLTDGAGSSLGSTFGVRNTGYNAANKLVRVENFIRDEKTQKTYKWSSDSNLQTETLIKMIRDRYQVRVVGFYVCQNRAGQLTSAVRDNIYGFKGNFTDMVTTMRKSFKDHGFYSMQGTGRDDLFIIPANSTKIDESELVVSSEMNARSLSKNLGKFLGNKKTSRVLLSRFIDYVA